MMGACQKWGGGLLTFLRKLVPEALLLRPTCRAWL